MFSYYTSDKYNIECLVFFSLLNFKNICDNLDPSTAVVQSGGRRRCESAGGAGGTEDQQGPGQGSLS